MKTRLSKLIPWLSFLCLLVGTGGLRSSAQTPAALEIDLYPGLTVTGEVGAVYSIEYVTDLSQANAWRSLEFLQLPSKTYLWVDPKPSAGSRRYYRAVRQARSEMVFIPPGTYRMGSPTNEVGRVEDEGPRTVVTLTKGFYIGKYKVTQRDYQWVIGTYPSVFTGDLNRPVETVSWQDAKNYCAQLTKRERAARVIPPNCVFRLPTEAEWEYACRAWTSTRYSFGDDPGYAKLAAYAWYEDNSSHTTHAVGEKLPNPWGLYDMHGGLWEWCEDWYGRYSGGRVVDPQGPPTGSYRVYRGGSWGCVPSQCRSATRGNNPEGETGYVGFRIVLAPGQP